MIKEKPGIRSDCCPRYPPWHFQLGLDRRLLRNGKHLNWWPCFLSLWNPRNAWQYLSLSPLCVHGWTWSWDQARLRLLISRGKAIAITLTSQCLSWYFWWSTLGWWTLPNRDCWGQGLNPSPGLVDICFTTQKKKDNTHAIVSLTSFNSDIINNKSVTVKTYYLFWKGRRGLLENFPLKRHRSDLCYQSQGWYQFIPILAHSIKSSVSKRLMSKTFFFILPFTGLLLKISTNITKNLQWIAWKKKKTVMMQFI